jgi:predicted RNA-binding protein YlxR (DUF448 family)
VRTCVGCRRRAPKGELLRVIRAGEGKLRVDPSGSAPCRGAYIHPRQDCLEEAARRGGFARSFRTSLAREEAARLNNDIEGIVRSR